MALTLGRPEGNPPGGSGLALFYLEVRRPDGSMNGILVNRLKEKLGTRMVPTAELTLDGAVAIPVMGLTDGIKNITPMLSITRTWNAVGAVGGMRHGLALAKDYAKRRVAFGAPLAEKPLHVDTLAALEAEYEGAFLLTFRAVELLGKDEAGELGEHEARAPPAPHADREAHDRQAGGRGRERGARGVRRRRLHRGHGAAAPPARRAGAPDLGGHDERALARSASRAREARHARADRARGARVPSRAPTPRSRSPAEAAVRAVEHAQAWLMKTMEGGPHAVEAGARRLALTLGRALELGFLVREATRSKKHGDDAKPAAAARRFAKSGVDLDRRRVARRGRADPAGLSARRDHPFAISSTASSARPSTATSTAITMPPPGVLRGHLLRGRVVLVELGELERDSCLA